MLVLCWMGSDAYWVGKGRRESGSQHCCTGHNWRSGKAGVGHRLSNSLASLAAAGPCLSTRMGKIYASVLIYISNDQLRT